MDKFFQQGPQPGDAFANDAGLQALLRRQLPAATYQSIAPGLQNLGARASGELFMLAAAAEAAPPRLVPYDPWGQRVDRIETSAAWQTLERVAVEEAIVASAYQRQQGEWSRLHQFARLYLYHPVSATFSCHLAMTDGAARLIELHGDKYLRDTVLPRLVSTDPALFWTSGQWMTERTGGSDVSGTSTIARQVDNGWRLTGDKWFTSAVTSQLAMTLARVEENGKADEELSVFCLELRNADGALNGIRINRLKDKLGTRALPTAELTLDGAPARLLGERGKGVRTIATMLNITRLYNACCAAAWMQHCLSLARDYAARRRVFGKRLADQPLHSHTLHNMEAECRAAQQLVFYLAHLLGRDETGVADQSEQTLLRLLTPIAKLYTAKQAVAVASEALECFGGAGYIEDTGLPRLLRDAQVLAIWEGTTNVLSLDALRVIGKTSVLPALLQQLETRTGAITQTRLGNARAGMIALLTTTRALAGNLTPPNTEPQARQLCFALARTVCGLLLLEQADWALQRNDPDAEAAMRAAEIWCSTGGAPLAQG